MGGRSLLGWEEAFYSSTQGAGMGGVDASKDPHAVAVAWKEDERFAARAANAGFNVVLSPAHFLYFDIVQGLDFEERGLYWAAPVIGVERVYAYEPMERLRRLGLKASAERNILGIQA